MQNTAATSENPLTVYRAEEMIGLLETTGRLEEFDFSLMINCVKYKPLSAGRMCLFICVRYV